MKERFRRGQTYNEQTDSSAWARQRKAERIQDLSEHLVIFYIFWNLLLNTLVMDGHGESKILSFCSKDRELPVPFTDNPTFEHFEVDYYMYFSDNTVAVHPNT